MSDSPITVPQRVQYGSYGVGNRRWVYRPHLLVQTAVRFLGIWTCEGCREYFDAGNSTSYSSLSETQKLVELRRYGGKIPLLYDLDDSTNRLRTRYGGWLGITSKDITNTGYLAYFFSHFMKVFECSIWLLSTPIWNCKKTPKKFCSFSAGVG